MLGCLTSNYAPEKGDQYNAMNVEGKQASNKKEQRMCCK